MDKDRIEGAAKQAKGAVKEAVGKVAGDAKLQAEGKADQGGRQAAERGRRAEGHAPPGLRRLKREPGGPRLHPRQPHCRRARRDALPATAMPSNKITRVADAD